MSSPLLPWRHRPLPELLRLAWPITVSMLSYSTMTLVDTLFVGRLGTTALAAVSVGGITFFTLLCFGLGALRGAKVLTAQRVGAGDDSTIAPVVGAGLLLSAGLGLLMIAVSHVFEAPLRAIASSQEAATQGATYLWVRSLGAPAALAAAALTEVSYGRGESQVPMRAGVAGNVANIALDALFILGLGWGVTGAAAASALGAVFQALWMGFAQREVGFGLADIRRAWRQLGALWTIGWPLGVEFFLQLGSFATLTALCAMMSDVDVAAHQVAIQVIHFGFLPALAIGEAGSVLAGQAMGARRPRLVLTVAKHAAATAGIYAGVFALLLALGARPLASAFTDDPELRALIVRLFYIAAAFQIVDAVYAVVRSVLRGTGDVRVPTVVAVVVAWLCTPTLTWWLGIHLGWGVVGGWLGLTIEMVVGLMILGRRLLARHWLVAARRARRVADPAIAV